MRALPYNEGHSFINETLMSHGLLGTGPVQPVLAISVTTLELYRQCRLRCPQFSVQQWVKVLCDLANVCNSLFFFDSLLFYSFRQIDYRQKLREGFSDAFDIYIQVLRSLDQAIKVQLGQDLNSWHICHSCLACQYMVHRLSPHDYLSSC